MSLNVIFNASGILNFAQGHLLVVAGVLAFLWYPEGGGVVIWLLCLLAVAAGMAVLTGFQGLLTLLPLRSSVEQHSWIVTTLAASIITGALVTLSMGPNALSVKNPFGTFSFAGTQVPYIYLGLIALTVIVYLALRWFQRTFLVGLALSALSQDLEAARAAGAATRQLQVLSFAIAGVVLGLTGFLGASVIGISESNALQYLIFGFIVAVVGGLGNNTGALIAGPIFGVLLMYVTYEWGNQLQTPLAVAVIVAVLMLRPQGIFGRPHARRV
ncbi:branched-chain amino acid ABC transporter permease [Aeromicrobium chenweiae]|uniref:Branched-chain amino acid ABC transporter permease n=2 Tax=Aeromicrobium chenweiae TaxID=2079793 RepID=A0A2S0WPK2_9ACTN|nr:branched-chain amino acid ABC transporter permease [Aeromicrobium chenweiae]TGN34239.1 branched-chain amino acid ABC transporter permease [Aeromicrobium chenweiae]